VTTIPELPAAAAITAAADDLVAPFDDLIVAVDDVIADWGALPAVYSAPEADAVYSAWTPLDAFVEGLRSVADSARTALDGYATTLAALSTRRTTLVARQATVDAMDRADPEYSAKRRALDADIRVFAGDAEAADEDCAASLRGLSTQIGSPQLTIPQTLGTPFTDVTLGVGAAMLENYRRMVVPSLAPLAPPRLSEVLPDSYFDDRPMVQRPSGLWAPSAAQRPSLHLPGGSGSFVVPDVPDGWSRSPAGLLVRESSLLVPSQPGWYERPSGIVEPEWRRPQVVAPPAWMKWGGRGLSVAGAGIGYWSAYAEEYEEDLLAHPEWTDDERVQSAVTSSAVVGTAAVGGGALGAWGGAAAGAAIGSVVPGVGTVVGGIIGGVIGGVLGGWGASEAADAVVDEVEE
jgi:uncharacterized membrane protein